VPRAGKNFEKGPLSGITGKELSGSVRIKQKKKQRKEEEKNL